MVQVRVRTVERGSTSWFTTACDAWFDGAVPPRCRKRERHGHPGPAEGNRWWQAEADEVYCEGANTGCNVATNHAIHIGTQHSRVPSMGLV